MIVNVPHVHTNPTCKGVLLPLYDFIVFGQGLLEHPTCLEAQRVIEGHCEGEFDVDEVGGVGGLSLLSQVLFLVGHFLCLLEGVEMLA